MISSSLPAGSKSALDRGGIAPLDDGDIVQSTPPPPSRKALVVACGAYKRSPLRNTPNDGEDMHALLQQRMGFQSSLVLDPPDLRTFSRAVHEFHDQLAPGDVALFYFAGHGCEFKNENYLLSLEEPSEDRELPLCAMNVTTVLSLSLIHISEPTRPY